MSVRIPYFKTSAAIAKRRKIPWWMVGLGLAGCIYLLNRAFINDLAPHRWVLPPPGELASATGHFIPSRYNAQSPYHFVTDSGAQMAIGCEPEAPDAICLRLHGISLNKLAEKHSEISYFNVPNRWNAGLSNVLVTLSIDGLSFISYNSTKNDFQIWAKEEERIKHTTLIFDLVPPLFIFSLCTFVAASKLRNRVEPH
jgi:hypothetical protein